MGKTALRLLEATVPKITVITRKAYGGAYIAMCSRHLRAIRLCMAYAEIAVMARKSSKHNIPQRNKESHDPIETRNEKIEEYRDKFANLIKQQSVVMLMM